MMKVDVRRMTWRAYVRNRKQYNRYRRHLQLRSGEAHEQWPWIFDTELKAALRGEWL